MMPDGGADEWLKLCGEKFPELADRTVIITGGPATARDEALVAANADRVVYKPFSIAQLRKTIARVAPRPLE
jgi:CheY-like chemotaxis protein